MQVHFVSGVLTHRRLYGVGIHAYYLSEVLSGLLIYFMAVFSPWAFGTTEAWSIRTMNACGYALGMMLCFKSLVRRSTPALGLSSKPGLTTLALQVCTAALLAYCLISALNARASYHEVTTTFEYHRALRWLPSSLDGPSSWTAFGNCLSLACSFWAIWDWLRGSPDTRSPTGSALVGASRSFLPSRLRSLIWVLAIASGLLAVEGIVQRRCNYPGLLFLVKPKIHQEAVEQFASYAYRANAAQYFNLVWPVCLGFWSLLVWSARVTPIHKHLSLASAGLMAACPFISGSRAPAIVCLAMLLLAVPIVIVPEPGRLSRKTPRQTAKFRLQGGLFCAGVLLLGFGLGWQTLHPRLALVRADFAERERLYDAARRVSRDYPLFGTGPGTFERVFQLYRSSPEDYWPAQLHNDWLETRITFGWIGSGFIVSGLLVLLIRSLGSGARHSQLRFILCVWLALAGCLVQARWDFPLQVYSIQFVFIMWCAALFALPSFRSPAALFLCGNQSIIKERTPEQHLRLQTMNRNDIHWGVLLALAFIVCVWVAPRLMRNPPSRAPRLHLVNASPKLVVSFSVTNLTSTNLSAFPGAIH